MFTTNWQCVGWEDNFLTAVKYFSPHLLSFPSRELIMKHGVCIRVLGDLELLPGDVLESVARAVNFTRNNDRAFLNVCFSYTSRHEMAEGIRRMAQGALDGMIHPR